jgi:regulatory protein
MKGVSSGIIDAVLQVSDRTDASELQKVIAKKRSRYDDQKLMAYLARQGFRYDDIREALDQYDD